MNTLVLRSDVYLTKIQDGRHICVLPYFNHYHNFVPRCHRWKIAGSKIVFGGSTKWINILVMRFGYACGEISKMAAIYMYCPILAKYTTTAVFGEKWHFGLLRLWLGNQRCPKNIPVWGPGTIFLSDFQNGRHICVLRNINQSTLAFSFKQIGRLLGLWIWRW